MSNKVSSTFDKKWTEEVSSHHGTHVESVIIVTLKNINSIIQDYFDDCPGLLLLDLEGLDFEVLKSMDLKKYRPKVIMMETTRVPHTGKKAFTLGKEVAGFLRDKNYYWITRINENSIFIDKQTFKRSSMLSLI